MPSAESIHRPNGRKRCNQTVGWLFCKCAFPSESRTLVQTCISLKVSISAWKESDINWNSGYYSEVPLLITLNFRLKLKVWNQKSRNKLQSCLELLLQKCSCYSSESETIFELWMGEMANVLHLERLRCNTFANLFERSCTAVFEWCSLVCCVWFCHFFCLKFLYLHLLIFLSLYKL